MQRALQFELNISAQYCSRPFHFRNKCCSLSAKAYRDCRSRYSITNSKATSADVLVETVVAFPKKEKKKVSTNQTKTAKLHQENPG